MAGKKKIVPTLYLPYDYDKEEDYINAMSDQGWQLIKGGLIHHTYEKSSQKYRYKLDYNNKVNYNTDEYSRYLTIFEEQGWQHINSTINGWQYFRKKYNPNLTEDAYELYTDDSSLMEMLTGFIRIARIFQIMFTVFLLFCIINFFCGSDWFSLLEGILEILAIALFELIIHNLKRKRINSKTIPIMGRYGGYVLLGLFFLWIVFMMLFSFAKT